MKANADNPPPENSKFSIYNSPTFIKWLQDTGGSIMFSTYQVGKVLFLGLNDDGAMSIFERTFPHSMGIGLSQDQQNFLLATQTSIYSFDNVLPPGSNQAGYDALFSPHRSWITGNLDIHDIAWGNDDNPVFVNTLFNCLATTSPHHSFKPLWKPDFVTEYVAEDRCHLNGLATKNGVPKYVTAVSKSDVVDGWRDRRTDGGVLIEVDTDQVIVEGLSMPHSPRLHADKLWLLNSGKGEFGWVDTDSGCFNPITFCPGFARGLAFAGKYAIVGLSTPRDDINFRGLPLHQILIEKDTAPRCGLLIIDIETGDVSAWVRVEGVITELYDVAFLRHFENPSAIGTLGPEIRYTISIDKVA